MRIVLTGGDTAGHVTPNIALIPALKEAGFELFYIGSDGGIEQQLIAKENIPFYPISAGKLRRYLDVKNITDCFRTTRGFFQSLVIIRRIKPDVLFSKGGFVSCPVVWAARTCRVPVVIHESDITPGLANRLCMPFAGAICYAFPETEKYIKKSSKGIHTGIPVRASLHTGSSVRGRKLCKFNGGKPVLLIIGGSQGSRKLNAVVREALGALLDDFQICHICGKGNTDTTLDNVKGYKQFAYVNEELPHFFAMADIIVSRAGATTLFEILELKKPNLLIPLSTKASRGDQVLNAHYFSKQGFSRVLREEELNPGLLIKNIMQIFKNKDRYIMKMTEKSIGDSSQKILNVIAEQLRSSR